MDAPQRAQRTLVDEVSVSGPLLAFPSVTLTVTSIQQKPGAACAFAQRLGHAHAPRTYSSTTHASWGEKLVILFGAGDAARELESRSSASAQKQTAVELPGAYVAPILVATEACACMPQLTL
jgi:hypothetical protein